MSITNTLPAVANVSAVLSGQNFTGLSNFAALSGSGTWLNTPGSVMTQSWYNDPANVLGGHAIGDAPGTLITTFVSPAATSPTSSFSFSPAPLALAVPDIGNFSMTEAWSYTLDGVTAAGVFPTLQSRGQTEVKFFDAPEPTSLAMVWVGLLGLGMARHSRKAI